MKMEYMYIIFCAVIWQCLVLNVRCSVYTGTYNLEKLLHEECKLVKALEKFIISEKDSKKTVSTDIEEFYTFVKKANTALVTDETHVEHPINAFHLIHRVVTKWSSIFDEAWWNSTLSSKHAKEFNETFHNTTHSGVWASKEDLIGAAIALPRLWRCYQLELLQLFAGNISGVQASPLSYNDVIVICKLAYEANMNYDVIIWLEKYMEYSGITLSANKTEYSEISHLLAKTYAKYGMPWKSLKILEPLMMSGEGDEDIDSTYRGIKEIRDNLRSSQKNKVLEDKDHSFMEQYRSLCRGDMKTPMEKSSLKCFLRKTKIPIYWTKEEVMNYDPRVSLFYDVISEKEIAFLLDGSKKKLERSRVKQFDGKSSDGAFTSQRISSSAWFRDTNNSLLQTLDRRVSIITGLNTEFKSKYSDMEYYQVINYGIGGMYRPHTDFIGIPQWRPPFEYDIKELKGSGDRMATWIFYLSDVRQGGATVFPYTNTRIPAIKGAAAFWYNLKPNGDSDPRTIHAGCPVLIGSKWICNRWIREWGQIFTRPCGLSKDATDNHPVI